MGHSAGVYARCPQPCCMPGGCCICAGCPHGDFLSASCCVIDAVLIQPCNFSKPVITEIMWWPSERSNSVQVAAAIVCFDLHSSVHLSFALLCVPDLSWCVYWPKVKLIHTNNLFQTRSHAKYLWPQEVLWIFSPLKLPHWNLYLEWWYSGWGATGGA